MEEKFEISIPRDEDFCLDCPNEDDDQGTFDDDSNASTIYDLEL